MAKVNLDALIPREDFDVKESQQSGTKKATISIEDLKYDSFFFSTLRKPDFQRETSEWEPDKVSEFIFSFCEGDLIPAIILWRSPGGYLFVIDGSHRISSLAAWINDDYGDRDISKRFYDGVIPEDQTSVAETTRRLVRKRIGSYSDFTLSRDYPEKVTDEVKKRAKNLGAMAIQLQWVDGDAGKAEHSFFKINQQAAPIDSTELRLLESRRKPNCIAARAIIRSGTGHKYWSGFADDVQLRIEELSKEIHSTLFSPPLETPVKTLDIPIGGKQYAANSLQIVLDFVNIVNNAPKNFKEEVDDDADGESTLSYLQKARKLAQRINSVHPSSLGLHPIVYFYSPDGRHKIASFYATVAFVMEMEQRNSFADFTAVRSQFEEFLINNEYLVQQINRKYRSADRAFSLIKDFFNFLVEHFQTVNDAELVKENLLKSTEFNYLVNMQDQYLATSPYYANEKVSAATFSKERKSAVFIKEAIKGAPRCSICQSYIHRNSITIDHITRKADGGTGEIENGQIAHPYCNTTYKN